MTDNNTLAHEIVNRVVMHLKENGFIQFEDVDPGSQERTECVILTEQVLHNEDMFNGDIT